MGRYDTVIFDLDGTLLNTLDDLADSVNYAMAACGFASRTIDEVRQFVGNGVRKLIERSVPGGEENPRFDEAFALFKEHYLVHCNDKTCPYPGVLDLPERLSDDGMKLAIVSNKYDPAVKDLSARYFNGLIPVAIGEREGVRKKPAPDTVFEALRELDSSPKNAVYVGDSDVDIETAQRAGLACISVSWGFRGREVLQKAGAHRIVDSAQALYEHIIEE